MSKLAEIIENKLTQKAVYIHGQAESTIWQSGMLSGWKITSIGDSLINLCQMRYCCEASNVGQYEISVMGDDVLMLYNQDSSSEIVQAMNAMHLNQHPDKTI